MSVPQRSKDVRESGWHGLLASRAGKSGQLPFSAAENGNCPDFPGRDPHPAPLTRREWFGWLARGAAAGALAAVGAALGLRNLGRAKEEPCIRTGLCGGCERAEDCGLPQALLFRDRPASEAGAGEEGAGGAREEGVTRG